MIIRLFPILLALTLHFSAIAQINRMLSERGPVAIRSHQQRISANCMAYHSFELRNGQLWAWGNNEFGQLGDGTTLNRNTAVRIGTADNWVLVAAAYAHSAGIRSDGTLWAWGVPDWSGSPGPVFNQPTQIGQDHDWVSLSAGDSHTLALKSDGTLWAWGWNEAGQLGIGNIINQPVPVQVGNEHTWTSIAAGNEHSLAIKADGTLWAWGLNTDGQLGNGNNSNQSLPVQIGNAHNWSHISGGRSSLALQADGTLWTWGSINQSNTPVQTGTGNNWTAISSGGDHLALQSNGTLWILNANSSTQLGTDQDWIFVAANASHNQAVKANGSLWSWGSNDLGQLGNGNNNNQSAPVQTSSLNEVGIIAAGLEQGYLIRTNGTLWSWGYNFYGQLGIGNTSNQSSPVQAGPDNHWVMVSSYAYSAAGIKSDGTLWAWGNNDFGQLGIGSMVNKSSPTQVGSDRNWVSVRVGDSHCLGLKSDGTLWAWGKGSNGQIGNGSFATQTSPIQIGVDRNWVCISAGGDHSMAVKSDGSLWGWGWNAGGEVGDGTNILRNTPVRVGSDNDWIAVSGAGVYSLARKSNGTVWGWGSATFGQFGNGIALVSYTPQLVSALNNVVSIRAAYDFSLVIKADGTLWASGTNTDGQLGTGNNNATNIHVPVGTETTWISAEAAYGHSIALKATQVQHCASGRNSNGQLGNGTLTSINIFNCGPYTGCIPPPAPVSGQSYTVCSGSSTQLTITGTGTIGWYTEPTGGTWLGAGTTFQTPALTSTTTFYAQDSTCGPSTTRTAVTVIVANNSAPNAPAVFSQNICDGETATLTGLGIPGGTISWYDSPSGGNWLGSGPVFITPALSASQSPVQYFFYAQDSLCLSSVTRTVGTVTVNPKTSPIFAPITPICQGSNPPVLPLVSDNGISGTWSPSIVSNQLSGTYTFIPNSGSICADSTTVNITVLPSPTAGIINQSGTTTLNCIQTIIHLTATGGSSYSWNQGLGNQADAYISLPGVYAVTVTGANGCTATSTVVINGNSGTNPSLPVVSGPSNVCALIGNNQTVMFTVPVESIPTVYTWTVPPGVQIISGQGNDTLVVTIGPALLSSENKQIRVRSQSACGISDWYIHYLKAQFPGTPLSIHGPINSCSFNSVANPAVYSINPVAAATGYQWTVPAGASITENNGTSIKVVFTGSFVSGYITVKATNSCGDGSVRRLLVTAGLPSTPGLINGPTNICLYLPSPAFPYGQPATYSITKVPEATSYTWSVPPGALILNHTGTATEDMITVQFNQNTGGVVSVYASNACGNSAVRSRSLSTLIPLTPGAISGPTDACGYLENGGFIASYTIPEISSAVSYEWDIPAGSIDITGQGTRTISFRFPSSFAGAEIGIRGLNGCGSSSFRKLFISRHNAGRPAFINATAVQGCPDRIIRYSCQADIPYTPGFRWTAPATGIILSGDGTSEILVAYPATSVNGSISVSGENACGVSSPRVMAVSLPACTGGLTKHGGESNKEHNDLELLLFPNPAHDKVMIIAQSSDNHTLVQICLTDMEGRNRLLKKVLPGTRIDLSGFLQPGVYMVTGMQGKQKITRKLIIY